MSDLHATGADKFETFLNNHLFKGQPDNLYAPMNYIMQLGGKRMRPRLLLMAYESSGLQLNDDVMKLALAIEAFHNFSLIHDDIMDHAPTRRGKPAVHKAWNEATAILAGDNMLICCYELILSTGFSNKTELLQIFTRTAKEVCEGQQMDMNIAEQLQISEAEYLEMIKYKTAVLPAAALQLGALAAGLSETTAEAFYQFGLNVGMAFQLQDDYLDAFGKATDIGKQEGGDIIENKKTLLYLHAIEHLSKDQSNQLISWYTNKVHDLSAKVEQVRTLFKVSGSDNYLMNLKNNYEKSAIDMLDQIDVQSDKKRPLHELVETLRVRIS
ncbi:MAG: polyprenyl synthetase family protein [Bacteroidota bacterium]